MKPKINSTELQNFCFGVAAKWDIVKLIILHSYNNAHTLITMNDKAETCLSCSAYVREQKMKYLANEKITNTAAGKIQTYLTCSNKLQHVRSIFYKLTLYSFLLDLFAISSQCSYLLYWQEMQLLQ